MAQQKTSSPAGRSRAAGPAAPTVGERLVRSAKRMLGQPVTTKYGSRPAVARAVTVRVPDADRCGNSAWFKAEGLCGATVPAVAVDYTPPGKLAPVTVYAFDGDGEATAKFLDAGGDAALGHREIPGAMIVDAGPVAADDETEA